MTADADFLNAAPSTHKLDVGKAMIWVRANLKKRLASQVTDIARLARGRGKISPAEYYLYQLYDDAKFDAQAKRQFLGKTGVNKIYRHVISPYFFGLSHDKLVAEAVLRGAGLPTSKTYAIFHPIRSYGAIPALRTTEELADFLRAEMPFPCFSKPINGWQSRSVAHVERFDKASDTLVLAGGHEIAVECFAADIATLESGAIFQRLLKPDPDLAHATGERVSTVRTIVLISENRIETFRAAWKIPAAGNIADNFWRPGNLLADVDVADGRVRRVITGTGLDQREVDDHPDTGARLNGLTLPQWPKVKQLSEDVTSIFPDLRIVGLDVAITDQGPVVVEVNAGGDMDLTQLASGIGVMDRRFDSFIAEVGRYEPLFAC